MEDEGGVKAPVTRLRRRLSVEQSDDARSSPAPNTPTKKRGGRRTAKPDLELIDENAPESDTSKKTTKRATTAMKELEKDEKPVTPSRRSTRIKSNTSLVLETTFQDSPRAKRATRRNSQVGSDNEAPLTPARVPRRTRRDSANVEKAEPLAASNAVASVPEIIIEEPASTLQKSQSSAEEQIEQSQSPSGLRKSPRLGLKNNKNGSVVLNETKKDKTEEVENKISRNSTDLSEKEDEHNNSNKENEVNTSSNQEEDKTETALPVIKLIDIRSNFNDVEIKRLSISNVELLDKLNNEPKKNNKNLNKSSSALTNTPTQSSSYKRQRTKSWAGISAPAQNDNKCYSDSESTKKTKKISLKPSSNGDAQNALNNDKDILNVSTTEKINVMQDLSVQDVSVCRVEKNTVDSLSNKEKILSPSMKNSITSSNFFDKEPSNNMKTLVYIEESDSNSEKMYITQQVREEHQEISRNKEKSILNFNKDKEESGLNKNDSCEPMDIDETLPDNNISNKSALTEFGIEIDVSENKMSPKGNVEFNNDNENIESRKSPVILSTSQTLDKTTNENKSTLVLSQLKDISNENNVSQSPQITTEEKANTNQVLNITQECQVSKKNISSNYLTSTPLQQKDLIKRKMQVNTSGINSNNTSKIGISDSKLNVSNTNESNDTSEESGSQEKSNLVDDEAEDAGDDYESGDSRDEEDKQYEKDHEIVQKGETLTSEDELSNDSDYEKDSFVVSSDPEDDNLLDDSSDDLSMSDNELKMTAKSKKKYNERKIKEQKKASREMFESRHKLNHSNNGNESHSTKIKKNRAILDSSDSEEENIEVKVKQNKRMRLDSSHETSINKSFDNTSKIQLNNTSQKSMNNDNDSNEVEMTFIEHVVKAEIDPLSVDVKKEPKTPQKEPENTSIQFIDPTQSEKTNKSQLNMTTADDPLEEADACESSDSSTNEHIQNYDSVLNDLNKSMKTKKHKEVDISLNIDKRPKQKAVPIVDQLNLTQTKTRKKKHNDVTLENNKLNKSDIDKNRNKKKSVLKTPKYSDNDSSASIDLHLLFSEDSNNSEDINVKDKVCEENGEGDDFIPLKKSQDKTDIFETSGSNNKMHMDSAKKKKNKYKNLDKSSIEDENCGNETEVQFFLDTTGTLNSPAVDKSFNESSAKGKKGQHIAMEPDSDSDSPMEVSNKSVRETQGQEVNAVEVMNISLGALNKSQTKTPKSDKKKKRQESLTMKQTDNTMNHEVIKEDIETGVNQSGVANKSINKSVSKTPKSEKKKAKKLSESQIAEEDNNLDSDAPMVIANKSLVETQEQQADTEEVVNTSLVALNKSITKTPKSDKKKKRTSESRAKETTDTTENEPDVEEISEAKENQSGVANKSIDKSMSKTPRSEKKKVKKMSESQIVEQTDVHTIINNDVQNETETEKQNNQTDAVDKSINKSLTKTPKSNKKKKKLLESLAEIPMTSDITETLSKKSNSDKKKAKKVLESDDANNMGNDAENKNIVDSKKRKRRSSLIDIEEEPKSEDLEPQTSKPSVNVSSATISQNKKRKIAHNVEDSQNFDQASMRKNIGIEKQQNEDMAIQDPSQNQMNNKKDTGISLDSKTRRTKKRKEREDDEGSKTAKVLKFNSDEKVQVPRLPDSILSQLEDKPAKKSPHVTKPKAISTTSFVVEETKVKRIKPSNYLEESIYLNDEDEGESKKQKYIKNPKVLPTLPTVSTSNSGYTTDFKVNILPKQIQFVAKSSTVSNYKNDYLQNKKMKRLGTYELYKRNRTVKMSKF